MKYLIVLLALVSPAVLAQNVTCQYKGTTATFIINDDLLLDTNENIMAPKVQTNVYEGNDYFGKVQYIIEGKSIIMKFDHIQKEYTCDL